MTKTQNILLSQLLSEFPTYIHREKREWGNNWEGGIYHKRIKTTVPSVIQELSKRNIKISYHPLETEIFENNRLIAKTDPCLYEDGREVYKLSKEMEKKTEIRNSEGVFQMEYSSFDYIDFLIAATDENKPTEEEAPTEEPKGFKNILVRFFIEDDTREEIDIKEVTENEFLECEAPILYDRNTIRENGVSQICLTKKKDD